MARPKVLAYPLGLKVEMYSSVSRGELEADVWRMYINNNWLIDWLIDHWLTHSLLQGEGVARVTSSKGRVDVTRVRGVEITWNNLIAINKIFWSLGYCPPPSTHPHLLCTHCTHCTPVHIPGDRASSAIPVSLPEVQSVFTEIERSISHVTGEATCDKFWLLRPYCTVLYCTVLYCTVLYGTVLYCTVQLGSSHLSSRPS